MKGLSGFMPQDPDVKLMTAQSDLNDLRTQETELYAKIGRQALAQGRAVSELESKLRLVQENMAEAQARLNAQLEKDAMATPSGRRIKNRRPRVAAVIRTTLNSVRVRCC